MRDDDMHAITRGPSGLVIANPRSMSDPVPLAYSHVAVRPPGGRVVFVAGQVGRSPKGPIAEQVDDALGGIRAAMAAAGATMADVAKLTVYIVGHDADTHRTLIGAVKAAFDPGLAPPCSIVPLSQSGTDPDQRVEIEAVGVLAP